ncbi:AMP-dependent synthetase/ligase [Spirochaeta cellobiosiphila]|uniref:AMP-dependent synthetase/ligase n=1 Tax=Spirochaeta cellobiosiphila TaxID=504483 RepID=UPI0003FF5CE8|nr:AMP-binding protein [Spirochaeta cellobiosiphila]
MSINGTDTVVKRLKTILDSTPENPLLLTKDSTSEFQTETVSQVWDKASALGAALLDLGVNRGENIGVMSDNRAEWYIADMAVLGLGASNVPRGSDSTATEMSFILKHADCSVCFVENKTQLQKILTSITDLPLLKTIIVFESTFPKDSCPDNIYLVSYEELLNRGKEILEKNPKVWESEVEKGSGEDLATIIYTSGTTGEPKGVMLHHNSFIFQVDRIQGNYLDVELGDVMLSVLPIWHCFERAVEYIITLNGGSIAYSKPIGKILLADMKKTNPMWFPSVPRIWESIRSSAYRKVKNSSPIKRGLFVFFVTIGGLHNHYYTQFRGWTPQFHKKFRIYDSIIAFLPMVFFTPLKLLGDLLVFGNLKRLLGKSFKAGISGGGALPPHVDNFFRSVGIPVLEGYGLTETGPVLSVRKQKMPVPHTIGPILPDVEFRILDKEGTPLPPGKKGVLHVKSPQVMRGYYKRPEATEAVLKEGWLNTGDLAICTLDGELAIRGREKDTIVLMGGENIEPEPIENKLCESEYIDTAVIVGQDQKFLGALIVPNFENLEKIGTEKNITFIEKEELVSTPAIEEFYHDIIQSLVGPKAGFKAFERIFRFKLLPGEFEVGKEMTASLKVRRHEVDKIYKKEIRELFH